MSPLVICIIIMFSSSSISISISISINIIKIIRAGHIRQVKGDLAKIVGSAIL